MDITNKTNLPIVVPLPGGKKLHLGPRATGQISSHDVDHPPLKKLLDSGDAELKGQSAGTNPAPGSPGADDGSVEEAQRESPSKNLPRTGQR